MILSNFRKTRTKYDFLIFIPNKVSSYSTPVIHVKDEYYTTKKISGIDESENNPFDIILKFQFVITNIKINICLRITPVTIVFEDGRSNDFFNFSMIDGKYLRFRYSRLHNCKF